MKILLTNDDGYFAPGICELAKQLEKEHEVVIVAPEFEHSGKSHSITLRDKLRVKRVKLDGVKSEAFSVSGTPADCVRVGMGYILKEKPDVVFSGCNSGYNAGVDILYSGTVSAAAEANILGVSAVAVSSHWKEGKVRFDTASKVAIEVFERIQDNLLEKGKKPMVININAPFCDYEDLSGIKPARIGGALFDYTFLEEEDEEGMGLSLVFEALPQDEEETDKNYLSAGYATVTPLRFDLNNEKLFKKIERWVEEENA